MYVPDLIRKADCMYRRMEVVCIFSKIPGMASFGGMAVAAHHGVLLDP